MPDITTDIDTYLAAGCGRCDKFGTPDCKVHSWTPELNALRAIARDSGLTEEMKWGSPCYTLDGANVIMLGVFKDYLCLSFFKGVLVADPDEILVAPGENSRAARQFRVTSVDQITAHADALRACIADAIRVEQAGLAIDFDATRDDQDIPDELAEALAADPDLSAAWDALTPGRRRGYLIHFNGAKQAKTRQNRIEKYRQKILDGQGMHDR